MDGTTLVAGLQIINDDALYPCILLFVAELHTPQSVPSIELGNARPVFEEVLEEDARALLHLVLPAPLVIDTETLGTEVAAVEEDLVTRGGVAVARGDEQCLEEVFQMGFERHGFALEVTVVGSATEI